MGVGFIHTDIQSLELHDWQLPSHFLATKESTLATISQDLYLCIRTSYSIEMGVGSFDPC